MAKAIQRLYGPTNGTGADQNCFTAVSSTVMGATNGARCLQQIFTNTTGGAAAHSLGLQVAAGPITALVPIGTLLAAGETRVYWLDIPMVGTESLHVTCAAGVNATLSGYLQVNG